MIGWISSCWGGNNATNEFEKARILATYADWNLPDQSALNTLLLSLKGQNPDITAEDAINSLLLHLEQDEQKKNPAFLLKNLLILDLAVEERLFLIKIGVYHNNNFVYMETGGNQLISSSVKDLIASYYQYIRSKAKFYSTQALEVVNNGTRDNFLQNANSISMLNEINICIKVQNSILAVSDSFMNGNKSPQLIQLIFTCLLKTYLFCFCIVSQTLNAFIKKIPSLGKYDLQYLSKLANYFSKDYTRNLLLFIERNKLIDNFKNLKYNELIVLDDKIVSIIDSKLRQLQQDSAQCLEPMPIPIPITEALVVENIAETESVPQRFSEGVTKNRRKKLELLRPVSGEDEADSCFLEYVNFYNEDFAIDDDQGMSSSKKSETSNSKVLSKSRNFYTKLSIAEGAPGLRREFSHDETKKFNKATWEDWKDVYCT